MLVHKATCPLCEAMFGLRVTVDDGQIAGIRGNPDDVWSRGHLCPKGIALGHIHNDSDRLRRPLVRRPDGDHATVSWDDALAEAERVLRPTLGANPSASQGSMLSAPDIMGLL